MLRFLFSVFTISSLSFHAFAQNKIEAGRPVRIDYLNKQWNRSSTSNDTAMIVLRDARTKKMARVELAETANDSSQFVGSYVINWGEKEIVPEIYIAPQEMLKNAEGMAKVEKIIQEGLLLRKPYFVRVEKNNQQLITIYDTPQQALQALEEFRRNYAAGKVDRAAYEAQEAAARAEAAKLAQATALRAEAERLKLGAEEAQRLAVLKKEFDLSNSAEKDKRRKEAVKSVNEALGLFKQEKFTEAESRFGKAVELDPATESFYFQYGVALNRVKKFNKSIVYLDFAKGPDVNLAQVGFYKGLAYMEMKDSDKALSSFMSSKDRNDQDTSPLSAFYAGVILFQQEKYEASKESFEYAIDNSKDKNIDRQAETYIEQIANAIAFKKEQQKKFILTLTGGLQYDSNLLSVSNSTIDSGTATDLDGYRWSYGGSLEYRPVYTMTHEFSTIFTASDMYSMNKSFKAQEEFQNTDPLMLGLAFPYKYKGKALEKPYLMTLTSGYDQMNLNADASGGRELYLTSLYVKNDNTFIMTENWFSTYSLEARGDTAKENTGGVDDSSATKLGLTTSQTFFQNSKKTEAWIAEVGASQNTARGDNNTYFRYDIAATYMAPIGAMTGIARLGYFAADYSKAASGRKDTDISALLSLKKPFTDSFSATISAMYMINNSNVAANDYKKYLILSGFTWTTSL